MGLERFRGAATYIEDLLFPGRCLCCGSWLLPSGRRVPVCASCLEKLPRMKEPRCTRCGIELVSETGTCLRCRGVEYTFNSNVSLFPYTGEAKRLLSCFKFEGHTRLALFFASVIVEAMRACRLGGPVVPVPPRPGRREPDAVEHTARALERRFGVNVQRVLARAPGAQQKSLDYEERRANLRGRISLRRGGVQAWEGVVLLDDVFTTGATLDACARVLREAGVATVNAVTLVMEE